MAVKGKPKLKLVHSQPVLSSDPTPERLLRSGGHFEEGKDGRGAKILTFKDDPANIAHRTGVITSRQLEAFEKYQFHWYHAGLAGTVPTIQPDKPHTISPDAFGGVPRSDTEANHRLIVRGAWEAMGAAGGRLVEAGIWERWQPLKWDRIDWRAPRVGKALNTLASYWETGKWLRVA